MNAELERFKEKLASFDWFYEYSDDPSVYRAGRTCQQLLFAEATKLGPDALDLYFSCIPGRSVG